jgi:pilus assembly protein CpaF
MFGKKPFGMSLISGAKPEAASPAEAKSVTLANKTLFSQEHNTGSAAHLPAARDADIYFTDAKLETADYLAAKKRLTQIMLERLDFGSLETLSDEYKKQRVRNAAGLIIAQDIAMPLTSAQVDLLKDQAVNDLLGFGPIEVLMDDPEISDILINGHEQVYIERHGKLMRTDITFGGEKHLLSVIQKIVSIIGRRIDESSPMVDARMPDGSRFNALIPPLALDGCLVSIRKFRKKNMALADYVALGSMSRQMQEFLALCGRIRLNILISGGTGSGKTTLLNAISGSIDRSERIVTIEDTAELQLQQPHVLRMEVRPPNMEGAGEISQRQLMRNALRMRPDRIIIGEARGDEVIEMLAAMNTGHDGSMTTIHANSPRDALSRLENLVSMSSVNLSISALRQQIASAVHLVIQIARQRDGRRRVVRIDEVVGVEHGELVTQALFEFRPGEMAQNGVLSGTFHCTGARPHFLAQAAYFGMEQEVLSCLKAS